MNVLPAEANLAYEQIADPKGVNHTKDTIDVTIVVGANDVVKPHA